jgi:SnoaL-like domain
MSNSRPKIISDYMAAADSRNVDSMVACFTDDAVVIDENQEWRGRPRIREWRESVATAYEYTVEIRGAVPRGQVDGLEQHDVLTHLEGNFPGGTVDLTNRFGLRDGYIARLEIVPTVPVESP